MPTQKPSQNPWPEVLKLLRERTGWTQQQAAEEIGVTRRAWIKWEMGDMPGGVTKFALRCLVKTHAADLLANLPE